MKFKITMSQFFLLLWFVGIQKKMYKMCTSYGLWSLKLYGRMNVKLLNPEEFSRGIIV